MPAITTRVVGLFYLPYMLAAASLWCGVVLGVACGLAWLAGTLFHVHLLDWLTVGRFFRISVIGGLVILSAYFLRRGAVRRG